MEELIRDLLSYSRVVHESGVPETLVDLSESLSQALEVLKTDIEETTARVTADPLPRVRGETLQFAHVFQNLLSNALKYRKKEVPPDIHISAHREGTQWTICVRDNGIGFDQRYADRIFGLFKRLHTNEYPGTGLGLAICQRIVERSGGRIWAEGELRKGAAFYFIVPEAYGGNADTQLPGSG
jgi:light-regulated signal transduction histidine kinase (bacteriophytochrome)